MSAGKLIAARFPGRYIQGPGALERLVEEARAYSSRALVLVDGGIYDLVTPIVRPLFETASEINARFERFVGECSEPEIARIVEEGRATGAGVVIGIGGGKALDTAKAVGEDLGARLIVVPTIAASDAPCSALTVIYNEDGSVSHDRFLRENPDLVLVDTALISKAPARYLAAGIGDALATWFEAASCASSGALNCLGLPGVRLAYAVAEACHDTIFADGVRALEECRAQSPGPAFERVVEANILMSGIGFESGGVAAAHAIHHGLSELDEVHGALHGEKVAIGILAELLLLAREAEFAKVRAFLESVGLPVRLADLGITNVTDAKLDLIAQRACRAGEIIHNEPIKITPAQVVEALRRLV